MQANPLTGIPGLRPGVVRGTYEVFDPAAPRPFTLVTGYFQALELLLNKRGYFATFGVPPHLVGLGEVRPLKFGGRRAGSFGYGIHVEDFEAPIARFNTSEQAYDFLFWMHCPEEAVN